MFTTIYFTHSDQRSKSLIIFTLDKIGIFKNDAIIVMPIVVLSIMLNRKTSELTWTIYLDFSCWLGVAKNVFKDFIQLLKTIIKMTKNIYLEPTVSCV